MSALAVDRARAAASPRRNVLRSEWTKLWSLRSTRWSLLAAVIAMTALGIADRRRADQPLVAAGRARPRAL